MGDRVNEHVASVKYLVYMMSKVLRYQKGLGDRESEHVASVEYLVYMMSLVLRYRRGGWAIE